MLEISKLVKRYGRDEPVLKELDLTVEGSSVVSIVGASGAGKSTMLRCINRLVEPTSGSIKLNGNELVHLRGRELRRARRKIGMVFQGFNLIDRLTVMENVLAGRLGYVNLYQAITRRYPQSDIERAFTLMERVGIAHYANKRADELSGGERQRVGVVRALMQEPEILLADEPTASLDPRTSEQIMKLLQSLASELSLPVLINIHNVAQAKAYTERIVGLRHGRMIFDGAPADFGKEALDAIYGGIETAEDEITEEPGRPAQQGVAHDST
ncbi:phosphonate ABC transporter ATP-binding protein [Billgrantia desiderata]|uniref:Phosphonate ABC transporter ATP-binding protein n=1 Tax=Billgrantia desiderata TaxID=52021 RepID=A0AAW4YXU9_9GAMM|nr:phosphonate ABC transporter ATP-binding protein [Halomonas desiderata]MCH7837610.1 phosphonate ABC transporter ATP-binding protein [Chloroflexota bacterium]MCE8011652.1 phosphonate ABC transporter ATP-binding protein [Halomonas desiderata]MCE8029749.1 phosphonate ABC transporter ATP-binding protein [Halomonas desiderata]MCE8042513.1 phosphonate ABC transporter ATP-binding protein [Halomonas desiderata]MCE8047088.1 phosphonate ABC transporter ATP-binding protein [Halomonas desiderata]